MAAVPTSPFEAAREVSLRVATVRHEARERSVAAIRSLEAKLREVLAGESLRGLVDLAPSSTSPFVAARVSGKSSVGIGKIDKILPSDGRESLVILRDGTIAVAMVSADGSVDSAPAEDEDLLVEDLEPLVAAVASVLRRYVEKSERTAVNYARALEFARRVSSMI